MQVDAVVLGTGCEFEACRIVCLLLRKSVVAVNFISDLFRYPFLPPGLLWQTEERSVRPLHRHVFHIDQPSLAFVGLPMKLLPWVLFHIQVGYRVRSDAAASRLLLDKSAMQRRKGMSGAVARNEIL